jgi:hypothetical protein
VAGSTPPAEGRAQCHFAATRAAANCLALRFDFGEFGDEQGRGQRAVRGCCCDGRPMALKCFTPGEKKGEGA